MKFKIKTYVPAPLWSLLRSGYFAGLDAMDLLAGRRNPMAPPRVRQATIGSGDFIAQGRHLRDIMQRAGGLQPRDRVLEVGSGYGRVALALTDYLTDGTYDGVEIMDDGVAWCRDRITPRHSNFRFHHADLQNAYIRSHGDSAIDYRLPFPDGSFDFVFLTSVFTHLTPLVIRHYLGEIARVLVPGGTAFITYYLLDDSSSPLVQSGSSAQQFPHQLDGFRTSSLAAPEEAIAVPLADVLGWHRAAGIHVEQPIHFGSWTRREGALSWQDVVVSRKPVEVG